MSVRRSAGQVPAIVVSHVGGKTTDCVGAACVLVHASEELSSRGQVGLPAEPASMSSVQVHSDVGEVELREGIVGAFQIRGLGVAALGNVEVGDQVGQRVRLDNEDDAEVAVGDELLPDGIDICLVVGHTTIGNAVLAVRRGSCAVTIGEIVHDEQARVGRAGASLVGSTNVR